MEARMAMVAVPEASNEIPMLPALGDLEWAVLGGEVRTTYHPGGRVSHLYVTPDGKRNFRSWRKALKYMGEAESGPLAQQASERHKCYWKSFSNSCNPPASSDRACSASHRSRQRSWKPRSWSRSNQKKTMCDQKEARESEMKKDVDRNRFTGVQNVMGNDSSFAKESSFWAIRSCAAESSCRSRALGEKAPCMHSVRDILDTLMGRR